MRVYTIISKLFRQKLFTKSIFSRFCVVPPFVLVTITLLPDSNIIQGIVVFLTNKETNIFFPKIKLNLKLNEFLKLNKIVNHHSTTFQNKKANEEYVYLTYLFALSLYSDTRTWNEGWMGKKRQKGKNIELL